MTERQAKYVELTELVLRAAEGDLDAAGHARLEALLESDAQARTDYTELMMTVSALDWRAGAETHAARAADSAIGQVLLTGVIDRQREELSRRMLEEERQRVLQDEADANARRIAPQRPAAPERRVVVIPKAVVWLGLAAALALIASVIWWDQSSKQIATNEPVVVDTPSNSGTRSVLDRPVRVAEVAASLDAQWADGRAITPGTAVFDRPIELASGIIELKMTNGVVLTIEGPARLVPESDMRVTLDRGKLVGQVPVAARGFTVRTDTMDVVDLGAEFAVESGGTRGSAVHVLAGEVRLEPGRVSQRFEPVLAQSGDAVQVRSQQAPETIEAQPSDFYRRVPGPYERMVREMGPLRYWRFDGLDEDGQLAGLGSAASALTGAAKRDLSTDIFQGGEEGDHALWLSGRRQIVSDALTDLDTGAGFTVEAWVYVPAETDRRMRLLSNNVLGPDGSHAGGFGFGVSGSVEDRRLGKPVLHFTGFSVFDAFSQTPVPTNRWVHVSASLSERGVLRMTIDGVAVAHRISNDAGFAQHPGYAGELMIPPSDGPARVGDALVPGGGTYEHWVGGIDEVAVYDWVLKTGELAEHARPETIDTTTTLPAR